MFSFLTFYKWPLNFLYNPIIFSPASFPFFSSINQCFKCSRSCSPYFCLPGKMLLGVTSHVRRKQSSWIIMIKPYGMQKQPKYVFSDDCMRAKPILVPFHPRSAQSKNAVSLIRISWCTLFSNIKYRSSK